MALSKTVTTPQGFTAVNAYHKVECVTIQPKDIIKFRVRSYKEPEQPHFNDVGYACPHDLEGNNPLSQAYAFLKKHSDFEDAADV